MTRETTPLRRETDLITSTSDIAIAAQLACLLEVSAPKPGNVSPGLSFHDTTFEDFLASAAAIGSAIAAAGEHPLGVTIRAAIDATRRWTRANTNLGIVLLLAPLARAAARRGATLRVRLAAVLDETTVADAADAYAAIRIARPGGLGTAKSEDVASVPTVPLRDAMALAADRDAVAREYATDFALTFEVGAPAIRRAREAGLSWEDAAVESFLAFLVAAPDTLIARKLGLPAAEAISRRAAEVCAAGGVRSAAGRQALADFDAELRDPHNARNPGTTADLVCAALFVVILETHQHR